MSVAAERGWRARAGLYLDRRVVAIVFLGFSSGLPLGLTGQTLAVWMAEEGVSLTAIGLFALVGLPYVLKFLWAPAIDALRVPLLSRWLGRRRGWLAATQLLLIAAIVALGQVDPSREAWLAAALALVVAFASASQDIVVDAYRIERLDASQQAAGMATYTLGYRLALLVATAGMFELVALLQDSGLAGARGWAAGYAAAAALVLVGLATALLAGEPDPPPAAPGQPAPGAAREGWGARLARAAKDPFVEFTRRPAWLAVLLFVMLFKFGDAFAGIMTAPFVLDIGFTKTDYGRVVKVFGLIATLGGSFLGGWVYGVLGPVRALWTAGLVQAVSNLMFVWLAMAGPDHTLLMATIATENTAGGFGSVIFVAFLSSLCRERAFTATQFALLTALSAVGRTVLSASAGAVAQALDWPTFFLLTTAAAVPGLMLLWWLDRRGALAPATPPAPAAPRP